MELVSDSRERASRYIHTPAHLRYGFAPLVAPRSPEAHGCRQSILQGRDTELAQSSSRVEHNTLRSCEKVQTLLGKWNTDKKKAPSFWLLDKAGPAKDMAGRPACAKQQATPLGGQRPSLLGGTGRWAGRIGKSVELPARALCISNCISLLGKPKLCVGVRFSFLFRPVRLLSGRHSAPPGCVGVVGVVGVVCVASARGGEVRCEGVGFARAHNLCRESI